MTDVTGAIKWAGETKLLQPTVANQGVPSNMRDTRVAEHRSRATGLPLPRSVSAYVENDSHNSSKSTTANGRGKDSPVASNGTMGKSKHVASQDPESGGSIRSWLAMFVMREMTMCKQIFHYLQPVAAGIWTVMSVMVRHKLESRTQLFANLT